MSPRIFLGSDSAHRAVLELLPWYVNGTLEGAERAQVEAHVCACLPCRRELEAERALQNALSVSPHDPEWSQALAHMHVRLNAAERGSLLGLVRRLWHASPPLLRGALALQLAVILGLVAALALRSPGEYRTLSSHAAVAPQRIGIAVIFKDGRSEGEIRELLGQLRLRIVDGPTDAGSYTLAVESSAHRDAVVSALREHPAVELALPVSLGTP
jgi:hypothetical protein